MTCGHPGDGLRTRGHHVTTEAKYGGRVCQGKKEEYNYCIHEKHLPKEEQKKIRKEQELTISEQ